MKYLKVIWIHEQQDYPTLLYSELDDKDMEIRKAEVYRDGRFGISTTEKEFGGTMLSTEPIKPGMTNYEFDYIRNDPSLLKKTTFKIDGQEVKWNGEKFVKP